MTCDNCGYKHTCNKHRMYDEYNDKVIFIEYTDKTCDSFKCDDRQEVVTIKDIKPGFIFKCRGLLYPFVKYEDGTVHRVNSGELANLPETLPIAKIVCGSFGDTVDNFYPAVLHLKKGEYECTDNYRLYDSVNDARDAMKSIVETRKNWDKDKIKKVIVRINDAVIFFKNGKEQRYAVSHVERT